MTNRKIIKTAIASIAIFMVIYYAFFYFTTAASSSVKENFVTKNINDIKQDSFNSLTISDDSYTFNIDKQSFTISNDSLVGTLTKNKNNLNEKQFLVIINSKNTYDQIVKTIDALSMTEIKNYELVSE